ncbi:hypothetical protein BS17DRAFT_537995 [Gyrodon lividus]|nr:hypothetical protein BS17DRAFT_537995 [Gyrodon lividus]
MAHFPPSVLAYLRKVQALLRFVLRRPAARNVLQHLWSFILRRLQSCTDLLSRPRPEVTARKDQRMNAGSRTTPKSTHNTGGTFPAESSCSQLPIPICTPLDPSSVEVTSQETDPPAPELSYQSSPQPTNFQDTSSVRDPLLRADNSRETIPLALMGFCWNSSQYTDLKGASSSTQQLVPQPERGESMKLPSDPPSEPHTPAVRASHLDLLASAVPVVPEQLQRYNREFKRNQTHYIEAIQPRKLDYTEDGPGSCTRMVRRISSLRDP